MSSTKLWSIIAMMGLVEVLSSFESVMIITALPRISVEYGNLVKVGWLITGFVLAQAATAAICGRLGDLYGRRRVLTAIVLVCGCGSLLSALSESLELIILGRVIQGASGAILPLCYGMAREIAPPRQVPLIIGCLTGAYAVAGAVGYVLGGILTDLGGWQLIFTCSAAYAFALVVPMLLILPKGKQASPHQAIDLAGLAFVPAVVCLLLGVTLAPRHGWDSLQVLTLLALAVGIAGLWARHEIQQENPLIDVRLILRRRILIGNMCFALLFLGSTQLALVLLIVLQQPAAAGLGLGISATLAGVAKLPSSLVGAITSPWAGHISGRFGSRTAVIVGASACALGWLMLLFFHYSLAEVLIGSVIVGAGLTMSMVAIPNLILEEAPADRSSEATGLAIVTRGIATAVGVQIMTSLLSSPHKRGAASLVSEAAFERTAWYIIGTAAAIIALGVLLPRGRPAAGKPT